MSFALTTSMDDYEKQQLALREEAARNAAARAENVRVLTRLWLALGPDVLLFDGTRHDAELAEARGLAGHRWSRLLDLEQQVLRDEAALASRPKARPAELGDDLLPDRTIASRGQAWQDETRARIADLADLREQAKNERKALEALRLDFTKAR
jgi:hypothetical protein